MPSKKKKYNARFPPARIKKIMQADEEVGKVAAVVPVIICKFTEGLSIVNISLILPFPHVARTLEIFVESLLKKASQVTRSRNARTLTPAHIKASINSENQFAFLRDMVSSIPDVQALTDEDGNILPMDGSSPAIFTPSTSSNSHPLAAPFAGSRPPAPRRSVSRTSTISSKGGGGRARPRKATSNRRQSNSQVADQSTVSLEEDDDDDLEDLEDEEDNNNGNEDEDDEGSSCDNSTTVPSSSNATVTSSTLPVPPPHPSHPSSSFTVTNSSNSRSKNAADLIDDDYDDV